MKPFFGQEKMKLLPELYEKLLKESLKSKGKNDTRWKLGSRKTKNMQNNKCR